MTLRVLVVDRSPPTDMRQGNALIAAHVLPRLVDVELTLVAPVSGDAAAERAALAAVYGDAFRAIHLVPSGARMPSLVGALGSHLAGRLPERIATAVPVLRLADARRLLHEVERIVRSQPWDVIHVRQLAMAGYVPPAPVGRLLELIDSETLATARQAGARARLRGLFARELERRAACSADVVTLVSPVDAAAVQALAPDRRVEVVTNGVDTDRFDPASCPDVPLASDEVAFVGAMSFPPNVDAAVWLCREVLPVLQRRRPGVRIRLIGRDPVPAVQALASEHVTVTGTVDDVRPEILACPVVAIPMVSGSGVKNKVLEAMALARPIVSTTMGIESMDVADDRELVVADGPAAFADALDGLLGDAARRERLGQAARSFVVEHHSWHASAGRFRELYDDLAGLTRSRRGGA